MPHNPNLGSPVRLFCNDCWVQVEQIQKTQVTDFARNGRAGGSQFEFVELAAEVQRLRARLAKLEAVAQAAQTLIDETTYWGDAFYTPLDIALDELNRSEGKE